MSRKRYRHLVLVLQVLLLTHPSQSVLPSSSRGRIRRTLRDVTTEQQQGGFGLDELDLNFQPDSDFSVSDAAAVVVDTASNHEGDIGSATADGGDGALTSVEDDAQQQQEQVSGPHAALHNENR